MPVREYLSYTQGRKDQQPNKRLAQAIVEADDQEKIQELVALFDSRPHIEIQKDCALTLAWIAESKPSLVSPYLDHFLAKLNDPINRVIWGSMMSLTALAPFEQEKIYHALPTILDAMDAGTVVTRDHGYRILVTLYQNQAYQEDMLVLILSQLSKAPSNQLGQYAERLMAVMAASHKDQVIQTLESRFEDLTHPHHIKRLEKNLKKLHKR